MMAHLILARHGNTFETGQKPKWVGARTDLPLTDEGVRQAEKLANALEKYFPLGTVLAGPLLRTRRMAEILSAKAQTPFAVDDRLCEIDYGFWENKTSEEISEMYGAERLESWERDGAWPDNMNWAPSREKLEETISLFMEEQFAALSREESKSRVAITSNGILRFMFQRLTGRPPNKEAKVKTGHYCLIVPAGTGWTIEKWNETP